LQVFSTLLEPLLMYRRAAIADGQWWRLVTGNLVHLGFGHLVLNLAGLGVLWLLVGELLPGVLFLISLAVGALGVGLGLFLLSPAVVWYVGLSGALHTLWAAGGTEMLRRREPIALPVLGLLAGKLAWEHWRGALPSSEALAGGPVVTQAHLYGALAGICLGAALAGIAALRSARRA
jgi:rhomboid family GlyGly-CTERM serine protease